MPHLRFLPCLATLCSAVLLAACGGSGGGAGAPTGGATPTTLSVSPSVLALMVSGNPRTFTVTNTGTAPALSVIYSMSPALPAGTTHMSTCSTLAPGASCTITVTPGATASALKGVTNPVPITFNVGGVNTDIPSVTAHVLEYGSVYQSGYVFAFDDTTPADGSVGGKAAALSDESAGVPWGASAGGAPAFIDIAGVNEDSTGPLPSCDGNIDGACNTTVIVADASHATTDPVFYAAGACDASTKDGPTDWYLPAICEMVYSAAAGCSLAQQTIQTNLIDGTVVGFPQTYWSSTQHSLAPAAESWAHQFSIGAVAQPPSNKSSSFPVRCVRALTL